MIDQPPPIVVTARALPPARSEGAQGVVVIGPEALERSASQALDQVVRSVPGVQLFRRSDARSANPTSQGVTFRGLGGNAASRALVLLDGVPQGDPFGGWIYWPGLDVAGLGEVRITRGGGSVIFGPGALTGTIELDSDRRNGVRAALDGGLNGAGEARLSAVQGGWALAAWGESDKGFVPVVAKDRGTADRRAPFSFGGVRSSIRTGNVELGGSLFADRRERGLPFSDNQSRGADLFGRWRSEGRASVTLFHQERRFDSEFSTASATRATVTPTLFQKVPARATGWSAEVRPLSGPLELRLGSDGRIASGRSEELATFVGGQPTRTRVAAGKQATLGLFADASTSIGGAVLSGGLRIDRWWLRGLELEERSIATDALLLGEQAADRSGWAPTARVGARVAMGGGVALRGAAYLGWRLPTLNELVRPFRVGRDAVAANPALDPERLRGVEAGAEWTGGDLNASAILFANRLGRPIANVTVANGPGVFPGVGFVAGAFRRRENLKAITSRGIEAELGWRRGEWRAAGAISLLSARVADDGPLDRRRPAQVPSFTASAELGWRGLAVQLRHVGRQTEDDLGTLVLPAATTLDASAAWPLGRGFGLRLRGENLANVRLLAARSADGIDERATPRRLWVGLTLRR